MESDGGSLSGNGHLISETYCQASMIEYSVPIDNYLVSPRIRVTSDSKMRFRARVHTPFYGEHFGIAVSEKGNTLAEDFVTTNEWTIESKDGDDWIEYTIDLSAYEGKDIYVAIRHFFTQEEWAGLSNGYDLYALHVDDVEFVNVTDVSDAFRYDNYSSFSLRVNSVPLLAPANLEAKVLGRSSISLSWDAVLGAQSYSIYRNGVWVKNVSDATTYTDTGLKSNTTYTYKVAACANDKEYEHSNEVSATTAQEDYVVSIKSVSPNVLEKGENLLSIIMINDGKYEQESRSTVTLSTDNPYVAVTSGGVNINALYAGQEVTKEFYISVDESIPYGTAVEFNLNVAQKFEPYRTWDHTFVLMYGVETRVEDVESSKSSDFVIYDLCGRRVNRPIKGIYIVNGMKVIYK